MFSWLKKEKQTQEIVENALGEMKKIYRSKLLPLEEHYNFFEFHSPKVSQFTPSTSYKI
jgi:EH domain-containing protein 1